MSDERAELVRKMRAVNPSPVADFDRLAQEVDEMAEADGSRRLTTRRVLVYGEAAELRDVETDELIEGFEEVDCPHRGWHSLEYVVGSGTWER